IAGVDVAVFDANVFAGVDIDAVAIAARGPDGQIPRDEILAIGGMNRPHEALLEREVFKADSGRVDRFDDGRPARHRAAAERQVPGDLSRAQDRNVARVPGVYQSAMTVDPAAFPADFNDRIIREIGTPQEMCAPGETKCRV